MRSLTVAGVLVLAASFVACMDSLTGPESPDRPLLQTMPECIHVAQEGQPTFDCGFREPEIPGSPPAVYIGDKNVTGG